MEGSCVHPYKSGRFHLSCSLAQSNPLRVHIWAHNYEQDKVSLVQANSRGFLSLSILLKRGHPFHWCNQKELALEPRSWENLNFHHDKDPFPIFVYVAIPFWHGQGVVAVLVVLVVGLLFILSVFYPFQNKVGWALGTCGVDALRKDNVCQSQPNLLLLRHTWHNGYLHMVLMVVACFIFFELFYFVVIVYSSYVAP